MRISSIGSDYSNKNHFGSIKYNIKPGVSEDHVAGVQADILLHSMFALERKKEAIGVCLATAYFTKQEDVDDYPIDVTISPEQVRIRMPQTELLQGYNNDYYVAFHPKNKFIVKYVSGDTPDNLFIALKKANKKYFDDFANTYVVDWFMKEYGFDKKDE